MNGFNELAILRLLHIEVKVICKLGNKLQVVFSQPLHIGIDNKYTTVCTDTHLSSTGHPAPGGLTSISVAAHAVLSHIFQVFNLTIIYCLIRQGRRLIWDGMNMCVVMLGFS